MRFLRAKFMLQPYRRVRVLMTMGRGRESRALHDPHTDDTIPHGSKAREDRIMREITGFDLGTITPDELRANDELRRKANARKMNGGAGIIAEAAMPTTRGPAIKGKPIGPDEIAQAMSAKILGPTKNR